MYNSIYVEVNFPAVMLGAKFEIAAAEIWFWRVVDFKGVCRRDGRRIAESEATSMWRSVRQGHFTREEKTGGREKWAYFV